MPLDESLGIAPYPQSSFDCFRAASHLARATQALFGTLNSAEAQAWFRRWQHLLRHGEAHRVRRALTQLIYLPGWSTSAFSTLLQVQAYFQRHHRHPRYQHVERLGLDLDSEMVESACKWLIQQCFKGIDRCWSEDGFNHLLCSGWLGPMTALMTSFPRFRGH